MSFTTQVKVKNANFGSYKYENVTVVCTYGGTTVGEFVIPRGKARLKSTKKVNDVQVNLSSKALASTVDLRSELNAGAISLSSNAKMSGKVEVMMIMKVKKTAEMMGTIVVDVPSMAVRSPSCK